MIPGPARREVHQLHSFQSPASVVNPPSMQAFTFVRRPCSKSQAQAKTCVYQAIQRYLFAPRLSFPVLRPSGCCTATQLALYFTHADSTYLTRRTRKSQPSGKEPRPFPCCMGLICRSRGIFPRLLSTETSSISSSYLGTVQSLTVGSRLLPACVLSSAIPQGRSSGLCCCMPAPVESVPGVGAHCGTAPSPTRSCAILPPAARVLRLCRHVLQAPRSWFSWETLRCSMVIC